MKTLTCPVCAGNMKRNGKSKTGKQRWYCASCHASKSHKIDTTARHLTEFLGWLLSRQLQKDMQGGGRSFRRKTADFWKLWPLPPVVDEIHRVIYVDGIYLNRDTVVLIACSNTHVLGWYLAKRESAHAYEALMRRIAPPEVIVTDGGSGIEKARRRVWPNSSTQRCLFHVFCQVKRYTTTRPKLVAGQELYRLAKDLLHIHTIEDAITWLDTYNSWCLHWHEFLKEVTVVDGRQTLTHERLIKAKSSLNVLIKKGTLFTYLDPVLTSQGALPSTNNRIEGGVNAQIRHLLRDHRGLSLLRRIKAVFWWCYTHTEYALSCAEILKEMPTDDDVEGLYRQVANRQAIREMIPGLGSALVWEEFHLQEWYRP